MRMMGVLTIDSGVGGKLDGLVEVAYDFYYRRMTFAPELSKASRVEKEGKQEPRVDPVPAPYWTGDQSSFAYKTVKERWPVLIAKTIADVKQTIDAESNLELRSEGAIILRELETLKEDMEDDCPLRPIMDDQQPNLSCYNEELRQMRRPTWYNVSWLFSECYLYRLIHSIFASTNYWKRYDPFFRQKDEAFRSSKNGVLELAERFREFSGTLTHGSQPVDAEQQRLLFEEMAHICLWGNASDLSFSLQGDASALQEKHLRADANKNILVNDLSAAWTAISKFKGARIDIVLDNSGFELYADLIFALYLLSAGLAETIVLHPKSIPWFVSDVTPSDIGHLFAALADPSYFEAGTRRSALDFLVARLTAFYAEGRILIRSHDFWTTQHSYWRLPSRAPDVLADLQESDLVVFKGDLNYRKLTGDVMWSPVTPFKEAIGPMANQNLRILALRTCKADVAAGLEQADVDRLELEMPDWRVNGKCAMISFWDNKQKDNKAVHARGN